MRPSLFLLVIFMGAASPAAAEIEYPWCANFADGAGVNCGFVTYEQCMLTARGTGGYCAENTFYKGPPADAGPRRAAHKHRPPKKKE